MRAERVRHTATHQVHVADSLHFVHAERVSEVIQAREERVEQLHYRTGFQRGSVLIELVDVAEQYGHGAMVLVHEGRLGDSQLGYHSYW